MERLAEWPSRVCRMGKRAARKVERRVVRVGIREVKRGLVEGERVER